MGLADASNKDKMDKTIYQSDYFTGYGVKDWDSILSGPFQRDLVRSRLVMDAVHWTVQRIATSEMAYKYPVQS